jgi:hypothetical protein
LDADIAVLWRTHRVWLFMVAPVLAFLHLWPDALSEVPANVLIS